MNVLQVCQLLFLAKCASPNSEYKIEIVKVTFKTVLACSNQPLGLVYNSQNVWKYIDKPSGKTLPFLLLWLLISRYHVGVISESSRFSTDMTGG